MSEVKKNVFIYTRHEYSVPAPAAVIDIQKAIQWAMNDMPEERRRYGDACLVESRDDEIVVWWGENGPVAPSS